MSNIALSEANPRREILIHPGRVFRRRREPFSSMVCAIPNSDSPAVRTRAMPKHRRRARRSGDPAIRPQSYLFALRAIRLDSI